MFSRYVWLKGILSGMVFGMMVSAAVHAQESTAKTPELAVYWNFDEGSGVTLKDSSGNNNNGTVKGKPTWVEGVSGKALSFSGFWTDDTNYSNDCVVCEKDIGPLTSFTVEIWVKFEQFKGEWQCIVQKGTQSAANQTHNWVLGEISHQKRIGFGTWGDPQFFSAMPTYNLSTGTWYHLAGVMDNGNLTLYINGVARPSVMSDYKSTIESPLTLGKASYNVGFYFHGTLDEFKIYKGALSAEEIKSHYETLSQKKTTE